MRYKIRVDFTEDGESIATEFDVLSIDLRSEPTTVDIEISPLGAGHLLIETDDEVDAFWLLMSLPNATLGL